MQIEIDKIIVGQRFREAGDVSALMESISAVGLLNPIVVSKDFRLIAGLHRLEAFRQLGAIKIPAKVLDISGLKAALVEVDENLIRNELTVLERAEQLTTRKEIYEELFPSTRKGGRRGNQFTGGLKRQNDRLSFCQDTSKKTGQSARTVQRLIRIARSIGNDARDTIRKLPIAQNYRELLKLSRLPTSDQSAVAQYIAAGKAAGVKEAQYRLDRDRLLAAPCATPLTGRDYRLIRGKLEIVGKQIEGGSVDLVLSDPPYAKSDLYVFEHLGTFAQRVLKPGGSLVVMVGHYFLPEIIRALQKHLRFHWLLSCQQGGDAKFMHSRRVTVAFKPVLWFCKGNYRGGIVRDVVKSGGTDKRFHDWGQHEAEFASLVESFTQTNDLIIDPFVGGGTTGVAALKLGRRFVGIDSGPKAIAISRRRIGQLQMPRFDTA